mmetsp:Transcript_32687/g.92736  ORF Transcript_32687/g.92736 Transcript_32687/m.92736 type:complete len:313 (+) Transcript_32687:137-1075(+)
MTGSDAAMAGTAQTLAPRLLATVAAASVAETATFPVDIVKTRLQLQGEMQQGGQSIGAFKIAARVCRQEGLAGLYTGLKPAVIRHIPYSGTRILVFESLRNRLDGKLTPGSGLAVAAKMSMGLTAGAIGQLIAVPADLVKVRMQGDGRLVASGQLSAPRYNGFLHALITIVKQEGGVLGLWRGAAPAVQRAALVNLGELVTYDLAKTHLVEAGVLGDSRSLAVHVGSSICSGLVAGIVSTPADVVKTRMMNQNPTNPLYRGSFDCLGKSFHAEGLKGLYKGFFPTWARLGPWQMAFWVTYEQLRVWSGAGAF